MCSDFSSETVRNKIANQMGGPLHPIVAPKKSDIVTGISTEEYFAGIAMEGLLSSLPEDAHYKTLLCRDMEESRNRETQQDILANQIAKLSFKIGEKLVEERNRILRERSGF